MIAKGKNSKNFDFPGLLVAAVLLVNKHQQILIAQRPEGKSMAGLWEFPGGKVHAGETEKEALSRELTEELAITVSPASLRWVTKILHQYEDFQLIMPLYLCRRWSGDITPLEGQKIAWVSPEDLPDYPMPPADAPIIGLIPGFLKKF
ncbi:MAG: 8-oxo-dGTP diphosphatase MutT [Proteobacteria bacterium]|nr:8-oxo-dGTP diphosphatase MutT [Pseudomonadota bacterium]